jgi:hypothetical protein
VSNNVSGGPSVESNGFVEKVKGGGLVVHKLNETDALSGAFPARTSGVSLRKVFGQIGTELIRTGVIFIGCAAGTDCNEGNKGGQHGRTYKHQALLLRWPWGRTSELEEPADFH